VWLATRVGKWTTGELNLDLSDLFGGFDLYDQLLEFRESKMRVKKIEHFQFL
jgi:hypothetical protein